MLGCSTEYIAGYSSRHMTACHISDTGREQKYRVGAIVADVLQFLPLEMLGEWKSV